MIELFVENHTNVEKYEKSDRVIGEAKEAAAKSEHKLYDVEKERIEERQGLDKRFSEFA